MTTNCKKNVKKMFFRDKTEDADKVVKAFYLVPNPFLGHVWPCCARNIPGIVSIDNGIVLIIRREPFLNNMVESCFRQKRFSDILQKKIHMYKIEILCV